MLALSEPFVTAALAAGPPELICWPETASFAFRPGISSTTYNRSTVAKPTNSALQPKSLTIISRLPGADHNDYDVGLASTNIDSRADLKLLETVIEIYIRKER